MIFNNNYEYIDSSYFDNNSLDVQFNSSDESEMNNNYIDQNLFKGAHVVLVSDENPWYINKGISKKYISNNEFLNDIDSSTHGMSPHEIYKSNAKLDTTLPDLGLGHSFIQRKVTMDGIDYLSGTEGFSDTKSDIMNRNILLIILLILIFFYLYHNYKRKN
jgi:hypothetical protein